MFNVLCLMDSSGNEQMISEKNCFVLPDSVGNTLSSDKKKSLKKK